MRRLFVTASCLLCIFWPVSLFVILISFAFISFFASSLLCLSARSRCSWTLRGIMVALLRNQKGTDWGVLGLSVPFLQPAGIFRFPTQIPLSLFFFFLNQHGWVYHTRFGDKSKRSRSWHARSLQCSHLFNPVILKISLTDPQFLIS